jgi:hypothetical protein
VEASLLFIECAARSRKNKKTKEAICSYSSLSSVLLNPSSVVCL